MEANLHVGKKTLMLKLKIIFNFFSLNYEKRRKSTKEGKERKYDVCFDNRLPLCGTV